MQRSESHEVRQALHHSIPREEKTKNLEGNPRKHPKLRSDGQDRHNEQDNHFQGRLNPEAVSKIPHQQIVLFIPEPLQMEGV